MSVERSALSVERSAPHGAAFLSYASQDAEAAKKICEALRGAGVEVWFDQSELRGGDAWDGKIRQQIKECALFLPIISANTQARPEGYFRLEWKLADRRTDLMGKSKLFLVPISIDDTRDTGADVPDSFLAVQWTRLPAGETSAAFCERVKKLLAPSVVAGVADPGPASARPATTVASQRVPVAAWIAAAVVALAVVAWFAQRRGEHSRPSASANAPAAPTSELTRARARIQPDRWQKQDFDAISATLDRLIQANQEEADAWALRSIINSLQVMRNFDSGTKPLEIGKSAAERALRLAPNSPLGELALGMHLAAMFSRGSDVSTARPHLERGLAGLPPDSLTRYADLTAHWLGYEFEGTRQSATKWLAEEPRASFPAWILAQMHTAARQPDEAEKWANQAAAADNDITGIRSLVTIFEARYYLRADLPGARAALDRLAAGARPPHRLLYARWLLAMAERQWDHALQETARLPEPILFDRNFHGPKALLVGLAHQAAGRDEQALAYFRESERLLRAELAPDPDNEELRAVLAVTLASAGRPDDARSELAAIEPLMRGRAPSVYTGGNIVLIAQAYGAMGDVEKMTPWLRKLLAEPSALPFTPASIKIDPRFARIVTHPAVQALLVEFAHLDQPAGPTVAAAQKSIAVLAFDNLSGNKDNEYFSDGLSEELLNVLGRIPGLRVTARTSAFHFKGKNIPVPEIGKQLGVAYVIEGSVRTAGSQVRIAARLINAADGTQMWSDDFREESGEVFAMQDKIAARIAQNLELKLAPSTRAAVSVNPAAHRLVLEARSFWNQRTEAALAEAESLFQRALEIDHDFAEAHAGLADVWTIRALYRAMDGRGPMFGADQVRARAEAKRAQELNPTLAEPFATLGYLFFFERRFREAEQSFARSLGLNPNYALARHWHALLLAAMGRSEESLRAIELSVLLDPYSHNSHWTLAGYRTLAGRMQEALATYDRALELSPGLIPVLAERALTLWRLGRKVEAVAAARAVSRDPSAEVRWWGDATAIYVLHEAGLQTEAGGYAERILKVVPAGDYRRLFTLAAVGRGDEALQGPTDMPSIALSLLYNGPIWEPWRDDPRFRQLMVKLGCAAEYKVARETLARMLKDRAEKK